MEEMERQVSATVDLFDSTTMDKAGGGSIGLTLGPRRGKYKRIYLGPQAEAKNDEDH
jgi:hypothetical protein